MFDNNLEVKLENYQFKISEKFITINLSLHQGLMVAAEIAFMQDNEKRMRQMCENFYANLFNSLSLLSDKAFKSLIHDIDLPTLACIVRMFRSYSFTEKIVGAISQRKKDALEEEPLYFQKELIGLKEYKEYMGPFVDKIFAMVIAGQLVLPDPDGLYF